MITLGSHSHVGCKALTELPRILEIEPQGMHLVHKVVWRIPQVDLKRHTILKSLREVTHGRIAGRYITAGRLIVEVPTDFQVVIAFDVREIASVLPSSVKS